MLGTPELILLLIIILLLVIAPRQITNIARSLGEGIRAFRDETKGIGIEPSEQPLTVFVSSIIGELSSEREVVFQAIQQIPLTKPWLFEFTPPSSDKLDESYLSKVRECDIFVLVIGQSISASVTREFELAKASRKPCLVLLKDCEHSKEAQLFVESIPFKWAKFSTGEELAHLVQLSLVDELIRGYREGWQKKLSAEHLTILMSIQELLRSKEPETEIQTKGDTPSDVAKPVQTKHLANSTTFQIEGGQHFDQRDFQSAIKAYTKAIFLDADNVDAIYLRGVAYAELGNFDLAISDYQKAISLQAKEARYYRSLATVYLELKKYDEVLEACEQAIALDPLSPSPHLNKGKVLKYSSQRVEEAKKCFRTTIEVVNEKTSHALSNEEKLLLMGFRADAYYCLGEYKNAIADYKERLSTHPNDPEDHYRLGLCYKQLGQNVDAAGAFEECILLGEPRWSTKAKEELK